MHEKACHCDNEAHAVPAVFESTLKQRPANPRASVPSRLPHIDCSKYTALL